MEDIFKALILGIVEGLTEFIPVSSTGHLLIVNQWIRFDQKEFNVLFDILVQVGAIFAVVVVFRKRIFPFYKSQTPELRSEVYQVWGKALVGTLPAVVAGALFASFIEDKFFNAYTVAATLIFYGVVFIVLELFKRKPRVESVSAMGYGLVLLIGIIQILAMLPGTSRSGVTIIGALLLGVSRVAAAEYTFFLAIPTMGAAAVYSLYKYLTHPHPAFTGGEVLVIAVGLATAFLVAWAVIVAFMKFISRNTFIPFGIYRVILGLAVLSYFWLTGAAVYK